MSETKCDYYPRMNALLQEEEISKLQVQVNLLLTENAALVKERDTIYAHLKKIEWLVTHCGFEIVADNRAQGGFLLRGNGVIYYPVEVE